MFFNGALWIKDFIFNRDGSKAMISCAEVFFCCFLVVWNMDSHRLSALVASGDNFACNRNQNG